MSSFRPLDVVNVDLADGIDGLMKHAPAEDRDVYAVFWLSDVPVGYLELTQAQFDQPVPLAHLVAEAIALGVGDRLFDSGFRAAPPGMGARSTGAVTVEDLLSVDRPLQRLEQQLNESRGQRSDNVSVVICTRDRPGQLEGCLTSLFETSPPPFEVIVVDNDPWHPETRSLVNSFERVRYVAEPRPGLSRARNAGLRAASGDVVAFTDDDTAVHPKWIQGLLAGFDEPDVMCVTGLVLPSKLDSPSQVVFEKEMGGFSQGFRRITYDKTFFDRYKPHGVPVWRVGAGANMAIRRRAFDLVGGFDERLGAGAAGCSEDSELWYRLLERGWLCRYEPAAVVFHQHRTDMSSLKGQAKAYIRGHVAALFAQYARFGHRGNLKRAFLTMPLWIMRNGMLNWWLRGRPSAVTLPYVSGYLRGLTHVALVSRAGSVGSISEQRWGRKVPRRDFLALNPYQRPKTEGIFYREKMRAIHTIAPDGPFSRILEIGGGQSGLSADLYPGAEVVSFDLDPAYAASPMNARPLTRFLAADATRLPFRDNSFDLVTMFDVLEHVPDHERAAAEAIRVLRPGGHIMLTSPNENWRFPYFRFLRPLCPTEAEIMAEWGHARRGYALDTLRKLFRSEPLRTATYITPMTSLGHDLTFSKLPERARLIATALVSPLTWLGYALHRPHRFGIERGSSWQPKVAEEASE